MPAGLQSLSSGFIKNAKYPDSSELGAMTAGPLCQEKYNVSIGSYYSNNTQRVAISIYAQIMGN